VIQFGGEPSVVIKLFSSLLNHPNCSFSNLIVATPCKDSSILRTLYQRSYSWEVIPFCMFKIVDLKKTLFSFREQIQSKTELYRIEKGTSITLEMTDSRQKATLIWEEEIKIEEQETQNVVSLSDIEMVRLLFGFSPENFAGDEEQKRLLVSLFPLDFYFWGLENV